MSAASAAGEVASRDDFPLQFGKQPMSPSVTFSSEYERELAAIKARSALALEQKRLSAKAGHEEKKGTTKCKKRETPKQKQKKKQKVSGGHDSGSVTSGLVTPQSATNLLQTLRAASGNSNKATLKVVSVPDKNREDHGIVSPGGCGREILTPPRKKKGKQRPVTSPLPVKVPGLHPQPSTCTGIFMKYCVWISNDSEMAALHASGFFGKGFLSKSIPERLIRGRKGKISRKTTDNNAKSRKRKRGPETGGTDGTGTSSEPATHPVGEIPEYLQLSLVEAFFLRYALSAITIVDEAGVDMSILQCWREFCGVDPRFIAHYTVYHYLRSRGWVPKSGLKFGVDFLAYRKGPQYYHSSYSIMVREIDAETLRPLPERAANGRAVTWATLANLNRLSSQVAKELVTCYVLIPPDIGLDELNSPACLEKLSVQQTLMRRWIPEKTRHALPTTQNLSSLSDKSPGSDVVTTASNS